MSLLVVLPVPVAFPRRVDREDAVVAVGDGRAECPTGQDAFFCHLPWLGPVDAQKAGSLPGADGLIVFWAAEKSLFLCHIRTGLAVVEDRGLELSAGGKEAGMATRMRWVVGVFWNDQGSCDTDEIVVLARGRSEAVERATQKWWETIGANRPRIRIEQVLPIRAGGRLLINDRL